MIEAKVVTRTLTRVCYVDPYWYLDVSWSVFTCVFVDLESKVIEGAYQSLPE